MDTKPLAGSMNPITSDAVFTALEGKVGTEGGVMTGPLELPGEPEEENQAATKGYVDEHSGGGDGASKALDNLELPLEWKAAGTLSHTFESAIYWDVGKVYVGVNSYDSVVMTSTDGERWDYSEPIWIGSDLNPFHWVTSAKDMLCIGAGGIIDGATKYYAAVTFNNTINGALSDENAIFLPNSGYGSLDSLYSAYFDGVYYVAVNGAVYASSDKETFSEVTLPSLNEVYMLSGMAANDSALVLLFADGSENEERMSRKAVYTTDGTTWSTYDFTGCTDWAHIATDGTIIVSIPVKFSDSPDNETAFYTEDCVNWTSASFDFEGSDVPPLCDGKRFLVVNTEDNSAMISYDGKSWGGVTLPFAGYLEAGTGGGGRFIILHMVEGDSEEWYAEELVTVAPEKTYKNLLPVLNMAAGGGGGDVVKVIFDSTTMSIEDLGVAVKAVCDAGKIPAIDYDDGSIYYCQESYEEEGVFYYTFLNWYNPLPASFLAVGVIWLTYNESDGWAFDRANRNIVVSEN